MVASGLHVALLAEGARRRVRALPSELTDHATGVVRRIAPQDCSSFTSKIPHNSPGHGLPGKEMGTCRMYGDTAKWNKIIHRPLPGWYNDMKFGVFIHWGPYSVPSYGSEWFWHNYQCTGPGDPGQKGKPNTASVRAFADKNFPGVKSDYPEYADMFHAELYDAADWVTAIKGSGAQYVLPVAKHHDVSVHFVARADFRADRVSR
eukprot:COSAG02_NODE_5120_length_4612_cov_1.983160_5_plen_205_part_00